MKTYTRIMAATLCLLAATAGYARPRTKATQYELRVVTTIFPEYDWVRQIVGERQDAVEITLLLDNGVDLHSYQPTAQDIARISTADIFIYVGGESDGWVPGVLRAARNPRLTTINLLESLGERAKVEEAAPGMEAGHHHHDDDDGEEEAEYDEHVWLSLPNAQALCADIAGVLCQADPQHADTYRANLATYTRQLEALHRQYQDAVAGAHTRTLLFGDRFPFRYLTDDYGLSYYAAFSGCSAETEASFQTVAFLSGKLDELRLPCVMQIEGGDGRIARTIIQNSGNKRAKVYTLDSMQSTTMRDIRAGATYLGVMEKNLNVLKNALQ